MTKAVKVSQAEQFILPASVIGRADVARLLREIEKVDYDLEAQAIRTPDQPLSIPNMSRGLVETIQANNIAVDALDSRKGLLTSLRRIKEHGPMVQMTFATDAEPDVTSQLVAWIRTNLHPAALITVGLQPSLVGGCVIRTPDHIYDFSLRNRFKQELPELVSYVRALAVKTA